MYHCFCWLLLSHVWLFGLPWTAVFQASLSFTISQSLLKLMLIDSHKRTMLCSNSTPTYPPKRDEKRCPHRDVPTCIHSSVISFFKIYLFNWRLITFNTVVVLPYIDMNQPWVYMCPPSWTPLPPPSPSHASGSSQCTSPERPMSCIEPGLEICFTINTRFNAILSDHPTLAFSHRVQKSILYTCVSFAILHTGSLLPSF